jgi:integrase
MWYDRTIRKLGDKTSTIDQYRSIFGWVEENEDRTLHGHMLRYIAQFNANEAPAGRIEFIQQLTPLWLQQFHDSGMNGLKPDTQRHRWGVIRSFFAHLHRTGVIESDPSISIQRISSSGEIGHIPFTEVQYKAILENADWYVDERIRDGEREVYCKRMHAFLELLRWTGMDLIDAVQFRPGAQIDDEGVLRYSRTKTGALAVIPLQPHLPALLLAIPEVPKSVQGMPFRYQGNELKSDVHNWSRRCFNLFKLADIPAVTMTTPDGKTYTKKPEAKAFRHSFAVWALTVARMRVEIVSKMLGHKLVSTTEKHYLPWIKGRDAYLIDEVREAQRDLAKRKKITR